MTTSWLERAVELVVLLMVASLVWFVIAAVLDALFGWGLVHATRDFLDFIPPGSDDPGDCDPNYGSC